jgi:glycosyltransferase involved in cell wall biosynthesis
VRVDRQLVEPRRGATRAVLLIAFHFPPYRGSSGLQRTLRFAQHLPQFGWRPLVLSIDPRAYDQTARVSGNELPTGLSVYRAFGLDTARQLSVWGRYPQALALPDRWMSWRWWAVPKALQLIRAERVQALWTTFPIATTHRIGLELVRRTRLPWIAEFRDPMWQSDWPPEPAANAAWRSLETRIFAAASRAVFTAPGALEIYARRFPEFDPTHLALIENGYDEDTFRRAEAALAGAASAPRTPRPITLLHSGIIYRSERDPSQFFAALAALRRRGRISPETLRIVLRASGPEVDFHGELGRLGIADIVRVEPAIDYLDALREMLCADGLLLLQATNCNMQIPAKLYEYLRARRPILALTDPAGDTARTLAAAGIGVVARLDAAADIEEALTRFLGEIRAGTARVPAAAMVARYSREAGCAQLARLLDAAVAGASRPA